MSTISAPNDRKKRSLLSSLLFWVCIASLCLSLVWENRPANMWALPPVFYLVILISDVVGGVFTFVVMRRTRKQGVKP
jgi:hypothetical protein